MRNKPIIGILIFIYICMQAWCIQQLSVNYDEGLFAYYGVTILKGQGDKDIVKFDSKLPITALNMLPRAVEQIFHPGLTRSDSYIDIMRGRYISLLAAVLLALVIYYWSALLYGEKSGIFSLIIFLLCPNFLAHGIFVSSDIFACLFMTVSLFFLWKFCKTAARKDFLLASLFTAFAEISKFSMIHLLVLFPLLLLTWFFSKPKAIQNTRFTVKRLVYYLFLFAVINWFVISAAHLFYGMFMPLNDYQFQSAAFQHVQKLLHNAGNYLPVPFPSSYIKSMDAVMYFDHLGGGMPGSLNGPSYILGNSRVNGFWYYYFVVLFYKLPLPVLLLLVITTVLYVKKANWKVFVQNEIYLIIPSLYFLVYMDFFYSTQVGIRHIMIILPLLYIFVGFFFQQINMPPGRYFIYGLVLYQLISVGLYFPHFLPYTNELITNKKMAYKRIADTNLCYGEGKKYLFQYMQAHPRAKYLSPEITAGKIIMEVNEMLNMDIGTMGKYDWVRPLIPSDHIHSQYLVFDVTPAIADSLRKKIFPRHL